MLVVSDTSPLSNLAIIGRLYLLRDQFAEVRMPPAVARELSALKDTAARASLSQALQERWLTEMAVPPSAPLPSELAGLDAGEIEAIRLAMAISADHVLIDEKEARRCAAALGISTIGVLGVLIVGRQTGSVSSLKMEIEKLRRDAGFFVARALEERVLAMVGE